MVKIEIILNQTAESDSKKSFMKVSVISIATGPTTLAELLGHDFIREQIDKARDEFISPAGVTLAEEAIANIEEGRSEYKPHQEIITVG